MKKTKFIGFLGWIFLSLLLAIGFGIGTINGQSNRVTELTISAAASLKEAMEAIAPVYNQQNPNVKLTYNFGSSGSLQQQIEQGAPVDVFISAAAKQMDALEQKGLLMQGTRKDLLSNQLVLIVPKDNTKIKNFKGLTDNSVKKIALGEPESVPAGKYAQDALTFMKIFDAVKPKVVYAKDVRQVLNYVATGNVDAGVVYRSDTLVSDKIKVVESAPEGSHSPIVYPIAVIKASKNGEVAKKLVEFMSNPQAESMFKKYGFEKAKVKVAR
jgi:molybdate transport system substrate-binding protein